MRYRLSPSAEKQLYKLSSETQKKFIKQIRFLLQNPHHPSLRSRKMSGYDLFEARIDYHYRFRYQLSEVEIIIVSLGPHDEGLGKK